MKQKITENIETLIQEESNSEKKFTDFFEKDLNSLKQKFSTRKLRGYSNELIELISAIGYTIRELQIRLWKNEYKDHILTLKKLIFTALCKTKWVNRIY